MKECSSEEGQGQGQGKGKRSSEKEKEKTKLRERNRRSITTKIFNGLRKFGGYNLPPRADINDVLRALAAEAGWVVEPDGTTYRTPGLGVSRTIPTTQPLTIEPITMHPNTVSAPLSHGFGTCTLTGLALLDPIEPGDCSTTTSPRHPSSGPTHHRSSCPTLSPHQQVVAAVSSLSSPFGSPAASSEVSGHVLSAGISPRSSVLSGRNVMDDVAAFLMGSPTGAAAFYGGHQPAPYVVLPHAHHPLHPHPHHPFLFQEARASNHNTPIGSPQRHP
ncbi:protein BZR1 homolog 1 [Amborella trichopoda]|uniref:Protein BZR1 homolog n=1 Tax=Amborella trichopoda TaxID=13333 RepID=W1PCR3_AMBTC|nr:protein BZR1 homolog 1 [Amborella trichopoda]ERN07692.1 hypothetical protein AMTR_s00155p00073540 [Amborella trichopoda]|eukprot:XP_020523933.1 protein BZR1 homolog 1 [Amborella trichopoda]